MRVGNFGLLIPEGRERGTGHVEIRHGTVYTLRLANYWYDRSCDAEVVIDGKPAGAFRIEPGRHLTLERPSHDEGRFTFYEAASDEGKAVGGAVVEDNRGLIQVRFKPGRPGVHGAIAKAIQPLGRRSRGGSGMHATFQNTSFTPDGVTLECLSAGVTGLSGQSDQRFHTVASLEYDPAHETLISVRLVAVKTGPRELTSASLFNPVPGVVK